MLHTLYGQSLRHNTEYFIEYFATGAMQPFLHQLNVELTLPPLQISSWKTASALE